MVKQRLNIEELKNNLSTGDIKGVLIYPFSLHKQIKNEKIHVSLFLTEIEKFVHAEDEEEEEEEEISDQQVKDHVP